MYRVIVVDDEAEIREGIINKLRWEELGFEVVGSAENGIEALELVEALQPDLVMTDIMIPFMDGLTLAERIREISLSTKVIVFSGFDDFDYAKRAIQLEIVEYIMKPISAPELSATLRRLKQDLDQDREAKRDIERMRTLYNTSLPVMREQFLQKLLEGRTPEEQLRSQADILQMDLCADQDGALAVVFVGPKASQGVQNPLLTFSLQQSLQEKLSLYYSLQSFVRGDNLLLFVRLDEVRGQIMLVRDMNAFCNFAHVVLLQEVCAGVGQPVNSLRQIAQAYQEAFTAYTHSCASERQYALSIGDIEPYQPRPFPFSENDWQGIFQAVSLKSQSELKDELDGLFHRLGQLTWTKRQLEELCLELLTNFLQLIRNYSLDKSHIFPPSVNYLNVVDNCRTLRDLEAWCRSVAFAIAKEIGAYRQSSAERLADEAKILLRSRFADPSLSVEVLCRELHVSPTYFSTVFKRQTGQSFVNCLTEMRMQEAMRLLESTDDKTYLISEKIGYSDPNYFSYAFKKQFGLSPTQYRKQKFGKQAE